MSLIYRIRNLVLSLFRNSVVHRSPSAPHLLSILHLISLDLRSARKRHNNIASSEDTRENLCSFSIDARHTSQPAVSTMSEVNLEQLKEEIDALGETIKALKSASEVDKDAVGVAVKDLLDAKKKYADNNNGIGVDGKPYEEPMTKAQKKAKAKAEKEAGPAKPVRILSSNFTRSATGRGCFAHAEHIFLYRHPNQILPMLTRKRPRRLPPKPRRLPSRPAAMLRPPQKLQLLRPRKQGKRNLLPRRSRQ